MADLVGGVPGGVVHGRSATALTYDFSRTLARDLVARRRDRRSASSTTTPTCARGSRPPSAPASPCAGCGSTRRPASSTSPSLDVITERTRLVALTAASNLLGTRPPVATVARRAHEVGALVHVDAVHHAAHAAPDLTAMGADLVVCSPYKFFGPHCGALVADPALLETLRPDKLLPSTDAVPERFELGTLPYELLAGVTAAVDLIASLGSGGSRRDAPGLGGGLDRASTSCACVTASRTGWPRSATTSPSTRGAADRTSTLFLTLRDRLAGRRATSSWPKRDVLVPAGTFYAHETFRALGLPGRLGPADRARGLQRRQPTWTGCSRGSRSSSSDRRSYLGMCCT